MAGHCGMVFVSRTAGLPVVGSVTFTQFFARANGGWPSAVGLYSSFRQRDRQVLHRYRTLRAVFERDDRNRFAQ